MCGELVGDETGIEPHRPPVCRPTTGDDSRTISRLTASTSIRPAGAQVAMRVTLAARSRKLPRHAAAGTGRERQIASRASLLKVTRVAFALGEALQLVVEVGLDVLAPLGQAGQRKVHRLRRANRSSRNRPSRPRAAGRGWCRRSAGSRSSTSLSRPDRQEAPLLDRAQDHRLLVEAKLADLVEEQHAAVGAAQQAGAVAAPRR